MILCTAGKTMGDGICTLSCRGHLQFSIQWQGPEAPVCTHTTVLIQATGTFVAVEGKTSSQGPIYLWVHHCCHNWSQGYGAHNSAVWN